MEKYILDHQLYAPNGVHTNRFVKQKQLTNKRRINY